MPYMRLRILVVLDGRFGTGYRRTLGGNRSVSTTATSAGWRAFAMTTA
jgi:hypothetical protein